VEHSANVVVGGRGRPIGRANESGGRARDGCGCGFGNRDGLGSRLLNGGRRRLLYLDAQADADLRQRDVGQRDPRALCDVRIDERELGAQLVVVVGECRKPFGPTLKITSHGIPLPGESNGVDGSRLDGRDQRS
jgi:hypothetical protein